MNQKVLTVLEYNKIIEQLARHASSPLGKEKVLKLQPSSNIDEIRDNQDKTADALSRLFKKDAVSFASSATTPAVTGVTTALPLTTLMFTGSFSV